jgi:hypothetical protein
MEQKSTIWKSALTYGLYMGLISILVSVVIWATSMMENLGMWGSAVIGIVSLAINLILLIVFTKSYRNKELAGSISFGQAFSFAILLIVVSVIIGAIYNYIFQTLIDPGYTARVMAAIQEKTMAYLQNAGVSEAQMNKTLEKFQDVPTVFKSIKQGLIFGIIGGAILALISSAIVKKKIETAIEE